MNQYHLTCIIRPSLNGTWFIQNDIDHYNEGFASLDQQADHIALNFQTDYDKVGGIWIDTDDGFSGSLLARANLGLSAAIIQIRPFPALPGFDEPMNPADVWERLPGVPVEGCNLWVHAVMYKNETG